MPCTGTTSGESPDRRRKNGQKLRVLNLPMRFRGTLFGYVVRHCKAQNDALRSVTLTSTAKRGHEKPPAGLFCAISILQVYISGAETPQGPIF